MEIGILEHLSDISMLYVDNAKHMFSEAGHERMGY